MRKLMSITVVVAVVLFAAVGAFAAPAVNVGGLPLVVTLSGTSASTAADVTWTTPAGFLPDYIRCIDELDGDANIYEWYKGMASDSAHMTTSGTNISTYESEAAGASGCGFAVSAGSIVIDAACQQDSESYVCIAVRYQQ